MTDNATPHPEPLQRTAGPAGRGSPRRRQHKTAPCRLAGLCLSLLALCPAAQGAAEAALTIHLPRAVSVQGESMTLGSLAVLSGPEGSLKDQAAALPMGRCPWSREQIVITRQTILGRLAATGLAAHRVRLTGAEEVIVSLSETLVKAGQVVAAAESFLSANPPGPPGVSWKLARPARDLAIPSTGSFKLDARPAGTAGAGLVKVLVVATARPATTPPTNAATQPAQAAEELGSQEVVFKLTYATQQVVAVVEIAAGAPVTAQNARTETVTADQPADPWSGPYGLVAAGRIRAGTVIRPTMVQSALSPVTVQRRQHVTMRLAGAGFLLTGQAEALQDGRVGECIKVRNVDTERVVTAVVAADGSVEPVFQEAAR